MQKQVIRVGTSFQRNSGMGQNTAPGRARIYLVIGIMGSRTCDG